MIVSANGALVIAQSGSAATQDAGRTRDVETDEQTTDDTASEAERHLVRRHLEIQAQELAMDRVRKTFDLQEAQRAELLREWNAMRDLAMEQMKHDDEVLKKWIALI